MLSAEIFDVDFNFSLVGIFIGLGDLNLQIALGLSCICFKVFKPFFQFPVFLNTWIGSLNLGARVRTTCYRLGLGFRFF